MCLRYNLHSNVRLVVDQFAVELDALRPRYNIAPTQFVPLVRPCQDRPGREAVEARWGLVPSWAKDLKFGNRLGNACAETVAVKPSFRAAFKRRRCLVPASGFYEWSGPKADRRPHLFTVKGGQPFAFAGLWETWCGGGEAVDSFTILTTEPNDLVAQFHNRMPVVLHPNDYDLWLRGDAGEVGCLLQPYPGDAMDQWPVSKVVNNARNDVPECVVPLPADRPI
jgi:putative SOS response-associated peptidase YedK